MQAKKQKIKKQVDVLEITKNKIDDYWTLVDFMLKKSLKYDGEPMVF